jgi:hypothetical protein
MVGDYPCIADRKVVYKVFLGKTDGKRSPEIFKRIWENNIKMGFK